jgi:alpha-methylacyl-CoA racemase
MAIMAALIGRGEDGLGTHLDVAIADGVLWLTSLAVDEHLATGAPVGHGRSMVTGRYACYDTYRAADGRWVAVGAIEPRFFANLCRFLSCEEWVPFQLDDDRQDEIRAAFRAAFATRDRDAWVAELGGADTCVTPVLSAAELADDDQYAARGAFVDAVAPSGAGGAARRFRQVGAVLAGMERPSQPVTVTDPGRTDTDRLLADAGLEPPRIAELRTRGVVA